MRWLVAHPGPNFSVHDVWQGWIEALAGLGEDVYVFNLDKRLQFYARALFPADDAALDELVAEADIKTTKTVAVHRAVSDAEAVHLAANGLMSNCYQVWPDVIVLISAFFTPPEILRVLKARRHKIVIIHTECPYQDEEQIKRAEYADINLLNDEASLPLFRTLEGRAEYMPHAYRPSVHYAGPPDPDQACDLAFVGTAFPSRVEFFKQMDFGDARVTLAGNWTQLPDDHSLGAYLAHTRDECLDNDQAASLYRSAKAGINFYRREGDDDQVPGVSMGPREVEMAACGLWFMRDSRPESDATFPMLPTFSDPAEASDLLRWALAHPEQRQTAAAAARLAVSGRTFDNHARQLIGMLGA